MYDPVHKFIAQNFPSTGGYYALTAWAVIRFAYPLVLLAIIWFSVGYFVGTS